MMGAVMGAPLIGVYNGLILKDNINPLGGRSLRQPASRAALRGICRLISPRRKMSVEVSMKQGRLTRYDRVLTKTAQTSLAAIARAITPDSA
jgi:hypothetical protein